MPKAGTKTRAGLAWPFGKQVIWLLLALAVVILSLESKFMQNLAPQPVQVLPSSAYFDDGQRIIDLVFVYKSPSKQSEGKRAKFERHEKLRQKFEANLVLQGLQLEYEHDANSEQTYMKVHVPFAALARQAECEKFELPVKLCDTPPKRHSIIYRLLDYVFSKNPFRLTPDMDLTLPDCFYIEFNRANLSECLIQDRSLLFKGQQRIYLSWQIICNIRLTIRVSLANEEQHDDVKPSLFASLKNKMLMKNGVVHQETKAKKIGINYLLQQGVYSGVYPLHDSDLTGDDVDADWTQLPSYKWPLRKYLRENWGRWQCAFKYQPLDQIREYYGEKVAMYFAWLGFYTKMLIFPSIFGFIVLAAGILHAPSSEFSDFFCGHEDNTTAADVVFCRLCPQQFCHFEFAKHLCEQARLSRVTDNFGTSVFSLFMAIWIVCFKEFWKRFQNELCARWNVSEHKFTEQLRPEYNLKAPSLRLNQVTQEYEPYLPKKDRYRRVCASVATVHLLYFSLFFITIVLGLLATVMWYRRAAPYFWYSIQTGSGTSDALNPKFSPTVITSITASLVNGMFIAIMTKVYNKVAWRITEYEMPRTTEQFEVSYTYKSFLFQCVNFYGALFVLAFYRGQILPSLSEEDQRNRCPPTGCLFDVSIQLLIIMTGKQILNNFVELGVPFIKGILRRRKLKLKRKIAPESKHGDDESSFDTRWAKDDCLIKPAPLPLHSDYLEMMIQFGFITMFVPAFPLAPLAGLINNIIEVRLDAYKMLVQQKRNIPFRAKSIGPWFELLSWISKVAVLTNACLIAFTSGFIDTLVLSYMQTNSTSNIVEAWLTPFNTSNWCNERLYPDAPPCESLIKMSSFDDQNNNRTALKLFEFSWVKDTLSSLDRKLSSNQTADGVTDMVPVTPKPDGGLYRYYPNATEIEVCYYKDHSTFIEGEGYQPSLQYYRVFMARLAFVIIFEHFILFMQGLIDWLVADIPDHVMVRNRREAFLQKEWCRLRELRDRKKKARMRANKDTINEDDELSDDTLYVGSDIDNEETEEEVRAFLEALPDGTYLKRALDDPEMLERIRKKRPARHPYGIIARMLRSCFYY